MKVDTLQFSILTIFCVVFSVREIHGLQQQQQRRQRQHQHHSNRNQHQQPRTHHYQSSDFTSRRRILIGGLVSIPFLSNVKPVDAAPPISVIAEELGYFPVQNRNGDIMYVPKRVSRPSTPQAVELAKRLNEKGVTMYGAYWCPHCSRQKEVFGAEAWSVMNYVECSPKGYGFQGTKMCKGIDGYPTFKDKNDKLINVSGEQPLQSLAQMVGYTDFDSSLETEVPTIGTTCKLPKK
jgi:hypothetical protein